MRGRRSSRSAAVVLAGCVGLAMMAPGLALAAPTGSETTPAECTAAGGTWTGGACAPGTSSAVSESTSETDTSTPSSSTSTSTSSTDPSSSSSVSVPRVATPQTVTEQQNADGATAASNDVASNDATSNDATTAGTATARRAPTTATADPVASPKAVNEGGERIVSQAAGLTLPGGITVPDAFTPGAGSLVDLLGDLPIPAQVPQGGFTNPQQACAYLAGGLPIQGTPDQLASLGTTFSQFCRSLPTSFTGIDLDALAADLADLLCHLPDPHHGHRPIPHHPPHGVPVEWWGYWDRGYDVDCPELTYDEANAILDWDRSDPFRLDRDNDGEACEANAHGDDVEYVEYVGYPEGGVATGDGSTDPSASPVEVALAAGALSGLGATGLVLARRFARQG